MMLKLLILSMAILAVFGAAQGFSLEHAQAEADEPSVEIDDQADGNLDWLRYLSDNHRYKRRKFDKSDPRSLFAAVYSNYPYAKRFAGNNYYYPMEAAALTQYPMSVGTKRGLRSPLDPRNLFRAVYGYKK